MVQKWVLSIIKFWLEKGVDGFRLDTANYFFHDKKFRNNPALSNKKSIQILIINKNLSIQLIRKKT